MLTREERDKWANALRSGKFEQGKGTLRTFDNTYCCLGVLCAVLNKPLDYSYILERRNSLNGTITNKQQNEFIAMNDGKEMNFNEIANEVDKLPVSDAVPPSQEEAASLTESNT